MTALVDPPQLVAGLLGAGGAAVAVSGRRELVRRWVTWVVSASVVGGMLWLGPPWMAAALAAGLGAVAAGEYARLAGLPRAQRPLLTGLVAALPAAAVLDGDTAALCLLPVGLLVLFVPILLRGDAGDLVPEMGAGTFGLLWLSGLTGLVLLGDAALPLLVAVAVADVGAWCAGQAAGGPRLSPLSPGKTWAGVLGGGAAGTATLLALGVPHPAFVVAVVVGAPVGDLLESAVKRAAGVKDAGRWLPGFGGLLDRIDSLLIALPLAVLLS